ncbi:MAG: hypothetical protein D5R97_01585 [Candidatus Syntrophonatronum acetioxidans]|uniref:Uncharacterized protein n=1 Tax=Candidatus Syntrophonatronum acetioxidans TaxID=1795816 RepID=A0A424YHV9_9FIRM|nr:MAG: hypothetical protein D5R97_01585 [Candidatus Syntrophonatronum acetioxidans]
MREEKRRLITRKQFLKGAGASLAGVTMLGGLTLLGGCETEEAPSANNNDVAAPSFPFNYVKLDPDKAAEVAYNSYKDGNG